MYVSTLLSTASLLAAGACLLGEERPVHERQSSPYLNSATQEYLVKSLPDVSGDIGELYAGSIPLKDNSSKSLFFMFQPATDGPSDKLMTYVEGGACSSLTGFFGGTGKWNWFPGQLYPRTNPYAWTNKTNMLWVEEVPGVGFSQGKTSIVSTDIANDFATFYQQFQDLFGIQNYKHFLTGSALAGKTIPYIANAMAQRKDSSLYDVKGVLLYSPLISNGGPQEDLWPVPYAQEYQPVMRLNDSTLAFFAKQDQACGFADYREKYFKFPASGPQPDDLSIWPDYRNTTCFLSGDLGTAATTINPCWDLTNIGRPCPAPQSILSLNSVAVGDNKYTQTYFNRDDVKQAIHAPSGTTWTVCDFNIPEDIPDDTTDPSLIKTLPDLIEATNRTLISAGSLNLMLTANGTLTAVQNMTWGGQLGFQQAPSTALVTDQGTMGTQHFERGLMWSEVFASGNTLADQPAVMYDFLQWVLGEKDSL